MWVVPCISKKKALLLLFSVQDYIILSDLAKSSLKQFLLMSVPHLVFTKVTYLVF